MSQVLAKAYRGQVVENIYRGDWVICDSDGKIVGGSGDSNKTTYFRSTAKPIQALPVIENGVASHYGFNDAELAIMCASHSSEPIHIDTVKSILEKIGLQRSDLLCEIEHTCSGKHGGMLALCRYYGWDHHNYLDFNHPVQELMFAKISELSSYRQDDMTLGIDGCGTPIFALPLRNIAWAWAKLANPSSLELGLRTAIEKVTNAMITHPHLIAGTNRFDTELMKGFIKKRLIAKSGADAIYCFGIPEKGWGCAVKLEAGSGGSLPVIILAILAQLGYSGEDELVAKYQSLIIKNHQGNQVGKIVSTLDKDFF